ncbi:MauE/DoxX family redox-associated membrane protein [Stackebrandtia soli]|uniref:MauE/DoxX family redox-associated membrane protein n=1 Tax=Stackebrandtia soli TaxID=1892856 RepID=UPI0039EA2ED7
MTVLIGSVTALVALVASLIGAASHLVAPSALPDALRAHQVVPSKLIAPVAIVVPLAELVVGAVGVVALAIGATTLAAVALGIAAVLFAAYAAYIQYALTTGRSGPCGCSRSEAPMDGWVVVRAGVFAACALVGALSSGAVVPSAADPASWTVILAASATFVILLWLLPTAMREPATGGVSRWTS